MTDPAIAALVREVLTEELARLQAEKAGAVSTAPSGVREERVWITGDAELEAFVRRILAMTEDHRTREEIRAGKIVFRLDRSESGPPGSDSVGDGPVSPVMRSGADSGHTEAIESGLCSERRVDRLPPATRRVRLGKNVKMTPLARDRLRRRGISIERVE